MRFASFHLLVTVLICSVVAADINECSLDGASDGGRSCSSYSAYNNDHDDGVDCGIYMAPSTVGNHSNLGIFTSKPMKDGEVVPYPEILIPMIWRIFGEHPSNSLDDGELWDRYIWEQHVGEIEAMEDYGKYRSKEKASCFIPGVGCTVNSMLDLSNIESASGSSFDEVVERSAASAGSFSPYYGSKTVIKSPTNVIGGAGGVDAGQELFASYGDEWIPYIIPDVAVTFEQNFQSADDLMEEFEDWIVRHEQNSSNDADVNDENNFVSEELLSDMWAMMTDFPHHGEQQWQELSVLPKEFNRNALKQLKHERTAIRNERVRKLQGDYPHRYYGGDVDDDDSAPSTSGKYWADRGKVSVEFLKREGKCQDHLRPGVSKIPHAGRGAFAARDLPKGTIVGFAPLVHIAVRGEEIFNVTYNGESQHGLRRSKNRFLDDQDDEELDETDVEEEMNSEERYTRPDLIVNYSFGHRNSTIYLTPYGSIVNYINHKSASNKNIIDGDDNDGNDGPNVRVQWPKREFVSFKPEWLTKDIAFLRDTIDKIGLSFDYVALRDIKQGEEVTMDYGDEWDLAWKEHVKNWIPPESADGYVHSTKFKDGHLRTQIELRTNPYPWNLHTLCTDYYKEMEEVNVNAQGEEEDYDFINVYDDSNIDESNENRYPCKVIERRQHHPSEHGIGKYLYTVEIETPDSDETVTVYDVPAGSDGVDLYDRAYSQMWHMKEAFRHKMYVPDDIFPTNWMTAIDDSDLVK